MSKVVVLGGTGLVGTHVVEALLAGGVGPVTATYHSREPVALDGVEWKRIDLREKADVQLLLKGSPAVVLCAGKLSTSAELRRDPMSSVLETMQIGINALEAAAVGAVERFVMVSSCTGYPEGTDVKEERAMFEGDPPPAWFGVGWMHRYLEKQLEWYCAHVSKIDAGIALRPTLIYGPHDDFKPQSAHFVPSFIHRVVAREQPIEIWGDGSQTRNLIHAADVASAVVAALRAVSGYAAYNVAAPKSVSVNEVLTTLLELDGFTEAHVVHLLDKAGGASSLNVSASAFRAKFGWAPAMPLREGLADTLAWYRKSGRSAS